MTLFRKRLFMTVFCINPDFPDDKPIPARLLRALRAAPSPPHSSREARPHIVMLALLQTLALTQINLMLRLKSPERKALEQH